MFWKYLKMRHSDDNSCRCILQMGKKTSVHAQEAFFAETSKEGNCPKKART
jgi:hypothetical protein